MTTHPIYGTLVYLDDAAPDARGYYCLTGSRAPLVVVETRLFLGATPAEVCADPVLGLHGREALVQQIADILHSLREAA